jgi:hypothetical protein
MLADLWPATLGLALCGFIAGFTVWPGFLWACLAGLVLFGLGAMQAIWQVLTGQRQGYSPFQDLDSPDEE